MKSKAKISTVFAAVFAVLLTAAALGLCMIFPNKYADEINTASAEFGLDPALVRSVVWAESKFDRNAVSDKGARGLMQLMPNTYLECARALGIEGYRTSDPFDPVSNLRCGCYYLSYLLDKFAGDERAALYAYNAGEANAKKFLDGEPVFEETAGYVKDVALAKKVYGFF